MIQTTIDRSVYKHVSENFLEQLFLNECYRFGQTNKVIPSNQFGFQKKKLSCIHAITKIRENVWKLNETTVRSDMLFSQI